MATQSAIQTANLDPDMVSEAIMRELHESRKLADVVSGVRVRQMLGQGETVYVPVLGKQTVSGPLAAATAPTSTDTAIGSTAVTVDTYGTAEDIEREALQDSTITIADYLVNHGAAGAEKVDDLIYAALDGATPTASAALATAGTLTGADGLYDNMIDAHAEFRKAANREGTHWIIGPDQEAALLKEAKEGNIETNVLVQNGRVLAVGGVPCIVYNRANANAATLNLVQAILVDASAAVAEAWKQTVEFDVDEQTARRQRLVQVTTDFRYGTAVVTDTGGTTALAVAHVVNPAA